MENKLERNILNEENIEQEKYMMKIIAVNDFIQQNKDKFEYFVEFKFDEFTDYELEYILQEFVSSIDDSQITITDDVNNVIGVVGDEVIIVSTGESIAIIFGGGQIPRYIRELKDKIDSIDIMDGNVIPKRKYLI